jgi:NAD+ synthase
MSETLRIAIAQTNPRMAAIDANAARLRDLRAEATALGADLLLAPEHALSGAVPAELAATPAFAAACEAAIASLAAETAAGGPALVVGAPWQDGPRLHDSIALLEGGAIRARRAAHDPRPGYDPGPAPGPVAFRGTRLGLMPGRDWRHPATSETLAETGAEILVALDSLPTEPEADEIRLQTALARVVENDLPLILLNRLGAEEEQAHDGAALILNADRIPALHLPPFAESLTLTEWRREAGQWRCTPQPSTPPMEPPERLWRALLLALRDHAAREEASTILLPLDGSPESALAALLAADAFGATPIRVLLTEEGGEGRGPSLARRLNLSATLLDLAPAAQALTAALPRPAPDLPRHLRQVAIDALAEATGALPIVTGSSVAPGAFAPLKHLPPTERRALAAWRNAHHPAGLLGPEAPGVPLPDALPDPPPVDSPAATLHDAAPLHRLWQSLARADYKRRQAPPGVKLGSRVPRHGRRSPNPDGPQAP